jgi:glycerol kinase
MYDQSPPGMPKDLGPLIGALDQGTSSTRFLVFVASTGELVTFQALPVATFSSQNGWAESDPLELLSTSLQCIDTTIANLKQLDIDPADIVTLGLTNQVCVFVAQ